MDPNWIHLGDRFVVHLGALPDPAGDPFGAAGVVLGMILGATLGTIVDDPGNDSWPGNALKTDDSCRGQPGTKNHPKIA